jgi:putative ABC transport system permease protein
VFSAEEEAVGRDRIVVLGHSLWATRFGADPKVIGTRITLDDEPYTVIGVLASGAELPSLRHLYPMNVPADRPELWKPIAVSAQELTATGAFNFGAIAKMKPAVSVAQALSDLNTVQAEIGRRSVAGSDLKAAVTPLQDQLTQTSRLGVELLFVTAGIVLLVACINIASLFLTRSVARQREFAVRQEAGATRYRLIRLVAAESLLVAILGGMVGGAMTPLVIRLIVALAPIDLPRIDDVSMDARVLLFTGGLSFACAIFVSILPAWRSSSVNPILALKSASKGGSGDAATGRLGSTLVALEVGASATCVVLAGLLVASMVNLSASDPGFESDDIVSAELRLPRTRYDVHQAARFLLALKETVHALPGVLSVGISDRVPLSGEGGNSPLAPEGSDLPRLRRPVVSLQLADDGYFRTLGIPLVQGRVFGESDRQRPPVALVAASTAARIWPGESAVGKRFRIGSDTSPLIEVVGDVRGVSLDSAPRPSVYVPYWHTFIGQASLTVRGKGDVSLLLPSLRAAIRQHDTC